MRIHMTVVALVCGIACAAVAAPSHAASYQVIYNFHGGDGAYPDASLIGVGGALYGTTFGGGTSGGGIVFSLDPATGAETVVYAFRNGSDGSSPAASLIDVGGTLYGTTFEGGSDRGYGTVFSLNPATGAERVVYAFQGGGDGAHPYANLIDVGGMLYGTTYEGGGSTNCKEDGCGTVFSLDPATGAEQVLYSFRGGTDGENPYSGLIDVGGLLYGTTANGGGGLNKYCDAVGCGTVFLLDLKTRTETVVHAFQGGSDGLNPYAGLIDVGGTLYGTTYKGGGGLKTNCGDIGCGTVFSLDPTTGAEAVVYSFQGGKDGVSSFASLIKVGGRLYGTTFFGGTFGDGTVFSVSLKTGAERVEHSFGGGSYGFYTYAGLINVGGTLYGTTEYGGGSNNCSSGPGGCGTVFAVTP